MYSKSHSLPRNRGLLSYRQRYSYCLLILTICDGHYHKKIHISFINTFEQSSLTLTCLYAQVDALRLRLEEKESLLSKKSQQISELTEEKSTQQGEISDLKDMLDVKERKVNVLQKKVGKTQSTVVA